MGGTFAYNTLNDDFFHGGIERSLGVLLIGIHNWDMYLYVTRSNRFENQSIFYFL